LLGHPLAFEALAQGCPPTALAFNMHLSIVGPLQFPPRDFCLSHLGMLELDLDAHEVLPPLKPG
jgi:hypothetical protein